MPLLDPLLVPIQDQLLVQPLDQLLVRLQDRLPVLAQDRLLVLVQDPLLVLKQDQEPQDWLTGQQLDPLLVLPVAQVLLSFIQPFSQVQEQLQE